MGACPPPADRPVPAGARARPAGRARRGPTGSTPRRSACRRRRPGRRTGRPPPDEQPTDVVPELPAAGRAGARPPKVTVTRVAVARIARS